jgi:hypothetical protein
MHEVARHDYSLDLTLLSSFVRQYLPELRTAPHACSAVIVLYFARLTSSSQSPRHLLAGA